MRYSKGGYPTAQAASHAVDLLHLAMYDPKTHPKLEAYLSKPVSSYSTAEVNKAQQLLQQKSPGIKLRGPSVAFSLQNRFDRSEVVTAVKQAAARVLARGLFDSSRHYVGAYAIKNREPSSNGEKKVIAYGATLSVGGTKWQLQGKFSFLEAVVAHDFAQVAGFGEGYNAFEDGVYSSVEVEAMRKDIELTAPGVLAAAAAAATVAAGGGDTKGRRYNRRGRRL